MDAETQKLVDDNEAEIIEFDAGLEEGMGADKQVDRTVAEAGLRVAR